MEWCKLVKTYIMTLMSKTLKNDYFIDDVESIDTNNWTQIMNPYKYQILYYSYLEKDTSFPNGEHSLYREKTFQEYVDSIANLSKMGSYDYMEFCKNIKNKNYKQEIVNKYNKDEKMKKIKNILIHGVNTQKENTSLSLDTLLTQMKNYIVTNNMKVPNQKPDPNNFRNDKFRFYETYTLWDIQTRSK